MGIFLAAALVQGAILGAAVLAAVIALASGSVDLGLLGAILWLCLCAWLLGRFDERVKGRRADA